MEVLDDLEKYKFDLKLGSKVRFVMSLIPRCIIRKEKVLIFCHNIAPINLFLDIFDDMEKVGVEHDFQRGAHGGPIPMASREN
ncbi:hypothetical protein CsSME_00001901 [Camellia sinensis var. sinensis]